MPDEIDRYGPLGFYHLADDFYRAAVHSASLQDTKPRLHYSLVLYHLQPHLLPTRHDAEGHCPPADIFIVLPQDAMGDAVLDDIKADMPGINVTPWDFALDPAKEKKPRGGSSHTRLIDYMSKLKAGMVSLSIVQHDLHLSSVKKLRETLNNDERPTTQALREMDVSYIPGVGRGSKSYLVKAT